MDACGNTVTDVQVLTIVDTEPPSGVFPMNVTIQCTESTDSMNTGAPTNLMDNCGNAGITITFVDTPNLTGCNGTGSISRLWNITDACDNSIDQIQTITIIDDTPPVPPLPPAGEEFACLDDVTDPIDIDAQDNCGGTIPGLISVIDNGGSGCIGDTLRITRTWTFTDACGNDTTIMQVVDVVDNIDPVPPMTPAPESYFCADDVPAPGCLLYTSPSPRD